MAASCGRSVGSFLRKCGTYSSGINTFRSQLSRQLFVSSGLRRKNLAAAGPEKFTEEFIQKQAEDFHTGRRHLANMMGEDPETFSQDDIDRSIAYLFPSGLFEKRARPLMKHPDEIFPKQRAVQWGPDGRPFNFLFYTGKQSFYSLMHELHAKMLGVEKQQDRLRARGVLSADTKLISPGMSRWLTREELEAVLVESVSPHDYDRFIRVMERLLTAPCGAAEEDFVTRYRRQLEAQSAQQAAPELQRDERGVAFSRAEGRRKTSTAAAVLRDGGSGRVVVNGVDYVHFFPVLQDREQLMFPLQFLGLLGRFDLDCSVQGGGRSGQAGALRLAVSRALLSFVSERDGEALRRAGLLTADPRLTERKKPGQEGARRKFTWKKR